jgi:kynurenine formamidase
VGPAVVVDVTANVHPDYQVQVSDLEAWEQVHGPIPDGAQVLIRTGWGDRWPDKASFLGTDMTGPEAVPHLHFPGISPEAAQWLVDERNIDAVGIDTPSIDYGQATLFETHVIMYEAGLIGYENIANLEQLPEQGAFVVALPMKIEGGSGGPLRIVGFVPGGE